MDALSNDRDLEEYLSLHNFYFRNNTSVSFNFVGNIGYVCSPI